MLILKGEITNKKFLSVRQECQMKVSRSTDYATDHATGQVGGQVSGQVTGQVPEEVRRLMLILEGEK